ncbi:MAG TPA: aldehyde dehydrogenase family protein [Nitrospiria bacterium]
MSDYHIPDYVMNWIDGRDVRAVKGEDFAKLSPVTGRPICRIARSRAEDVRAAVDSARRSQPAWAAATVVHRGDLLRAAALSLREHQNEFAKIVSQETGKSVKDALMETNAAVEMGLFVAGEGRRFYGRTTTSAAPNKAAMIVRQPLGVAGLIIAANTPIANAAWKAFPALLCGNSAVLKASEDTPATAWAFAKLLHAVGLPKGVFNVIQGYGGEAGAPLVESPDVAVVSFTGSCEVGRIIAKTAGARLAKVCLELGGKNPLIVCEDADLDLAVRSAVLSAFSNAGQRCAAGSRLIIVESVYEAFRDRMIKQTEQLKIGSGDEDDLGPVINEEQLQNMLRAVERARAAGAVVLTGGRRLTSPAHRDGFFMAPTLIEKVPADDELSRTELFGPITSLYRVRDFEEALALANDSPFGLTAAIHTADMNRAMVFLSRIQSGVAVVNGPTYGSEPHMPFGGLKQSGNGLREAGTEALDVYSDWKTVYINFNPGAV